MVCRRYVIGQSLNKCCSSLPHYNFDTKSFRTLLNTANVNVRIQENIKHQSEQILETIGVPRATAIDMFYRQIILNNGIPFLLTIPWIPSRHIFYNKYFAKRINIGRNSFLTNWRSFVPTIGEFLLRCLAAFVRMIGKHGV